jgi:dTDP-4-amino-4,6-dideoxygalactose transaminase
VLRSELQSALERVLDRCTFCSGDEVVGFEKNFADWLGVKHCIGVNSGTSALHLALIAAGVGVGDEVITVPMTFVATTWAISYVGARPVFVDVDLETRTMDAEQVERRITPRTKAIVPVHLYGQPANMKDLLDISKRRGIPLIEDSAQAHGASYRGRPVGTMGQSGCFSFYPGKNLGACGEGGALVTEDDDVARRVRALRDHAQTRRYHHEEVGFNYRMDGFQGAVLSVKLKYLEDWNDSRRQLASRYQQLLEGLPLEVPVEAPGRRHVWHLFVVLHPERDALQRALQTRGVQTGLHYPVPVHLQKAYKHLHHQIGDFPIAERIGRECLTLPMFPSMTWSQQDQVVEALHEALGEIG